MENKRKVTIKQRSESKIKGYIISVMCISVISSVVSMLAPDGEGGGLSKNIRLVIGLCVVLVCINPIKNIIIGINDLNIGSIVEPPYQSEEEYKDFLNSAYTAAEIENLKDGIHKMLEDRFSVAREDCSVSVRLREGEDARRELECIYITLYGPAIFKNTTEIESYLRGIFGCKIITAIG